MEGAATTLVSINVEIDAFRANARLFLKAQSAGDLLRTPILPQQPLYGLPSLPRDPWLMTKPPPPPCVADEAWYRLRIGVR